MRKGATHTRGGQLRRGGVRVSTGPWTIYAGRARRHRGRLIVALGRATGSAVTRSRIRRIARDVVERVGLDQATPVDLLVFTRGEVDSHPRRQIRADLSRLVTRAYGAVASRERNPRNDA